ncbi:MAG: hypothetical protein H0T44_09475 [Gemmatimonadales bacterium]|nr:hypothetical protein [Gemmatimonadales bacterium]
MTFADAPVPHQRSRLRAACRSPWMLLVLLIFAAAGGFFLLTRPRLRFANRLAAPVRLVFGDDASRTLAPGETITLSNARGRTVVAEWQMIRPLSADSQPMGEVIRGAVVLRGTRGIVVETADSRAGGTDYFAPLITNASSQPLRVMVNAGLEGAVDCGCAVRSGATRVFIGYYRLFRNSTVLARDSAGGRATFQDLGPQVLRADGTLGLRFEDKDLRNRRTAPVATAPGAALPPARRPG